MVEAGAGVGFAILVILAIFVAVLLVLAIFAFWIWMLVHAITNRGLTDGEKVAWVLVILFLHLLGALIYLCIGFSKARPPAPVAGPGP
jgi:hypothetical protein